MDHTREFAFIAFDLCTQYDQCELMYMCEPIRTISSFYTHILNSAIVKISFTQRGKTTTIVLENTLNHGPITIPQCGGTTNILIEMQLNYQENTQHLVDYFGKAVYEYSHINIKVSGSNMIAVLESAFYKINETDIYFDVVIE
jgi:hypothetical protein